MYRLIKTPFRHERSVMKMQEISNTHYKKTPLLFFLLLISCIVSFAQQKELLIKSGDTLVAAPKTTVVSKKEKKDSSAAKIYSPRSAAIRSAILPGLGQVYNKKYWKLPIVYGALGTSAGIFIYNLNNYRDTRFAYKVKYNMRVFRIDSSLFVQIKSNLKPLSEESLRSYRNQFRRDIDYSALFFIILWGLNVVDATVDAHLKSFDVSPDLTLSIKPGHSEIAGTNGMSLVLTIGKTHSR